MIRVVLRNGETRQFTREKDFYFTARIKNGALLVRRHDVQYPMGKTVAGYAAHEWVTFDEEEDDDARG